MTFALTKYVASGIDRSGPSVKRGVQRVALTITALAADVDLDIGDDAGTFWTDALADATYGTLATNAQTHLQTICDNVTALLAVMSPQLLDRVQTAAAGSNGEYSIALEDHRPNITVNAADGEEAWYIVLEWELADGQSPVNASYG